MLKIKAIGINARFTHSCLALFYLRNELEKHIEHCEVEICHYTVNDPYYILVQRIADGSADYLFFSTLIWNSDLTVRLIRDLLEIDNHPHIVVGGPQAGVIGTFFQNQSRVTVFRGDIEGADRSFYLDLATRKPQKLYTASFFSAGCKELNYPFRSEDFSGPLKNRHIYYESSRGCPFFCTYCLSSAEKGLFHKPVEQVKKELTDILDFNPRVVRFLDRTFNDRPERACEIWKFLMEFECDTLFHFEIAPDRFTEEMFALLKNVKSGKFQFELGIQSTNKKTLEAIRRPMDAIQAGVVIRRLRDMETIHLHADLILGLPEETQETFLGSFDDIMRMRPHYIQMGLLKVLPDTEIARQADQFGMKVSQSPPYSVLGNRWISPEDFRNLFWFSECVEAFVNNRYFIGFWNYLVAREEGLSPFFWKLGQQYLAAGYHWKAATQETLSSFLVDSISERPDSKILFELLRYDWLRCGHRYLPQHLSDPDITIDEFRRELFHQMPEELDGVFDRRSKGYFFKKAVFFIFSRESLDHIGYEVSGPRAVIRFSPERESKVLALHKADIIMDS